MSKKSRNHDLWLTENLRQVSLLSADRLNSLYPEGLTNKIICPLCWRSFHIDENVFTNEHVPAKSIKSSFITRTCKDCNNRAGYELEDELQKHNKFWDVLQKTPNTSFDAIVTTSDSQTYNATILIDENGQLQARVQQKRNNPSVFNFLRDSFPGDTRSIFKPIDGGNERHAQIAVLKSAYLTAFRYLGYGYLFSPAYPILRLISEQIANPDLPILPDFGLSPIPNDLTLGLLNIITSPKPLAGVLVVFDFRLQPSKADRIGVLLPSAIGDNLSYYETIKSYVGSYIQLGYYDLNV